MIYHFKVMGDFAVAAVSVEATTLELALSEVSEGIKNPVDCGIEFFAFTRDRDRGAWVQVEPLSPSLQPIQFAIIIDCDKMVEYEFDSVEAFSAFAQTQPFDPETGYIETKLLNRYG